MRRLSAWALPLLCLSLLPLGGCAFLRAITGGVQPELTFREVRFTGWSLDQVQLDLVYELDNPYDVPLKLAEVAYQLEIEGKKVLSGAPKQGLQIQARRKQELVFPASVHFLDVIPTVKALFTKSSLGYRASGRLGVSTPVGVVGMPISKTGLIEVPKLPSVDIASVSMPKKGLTDATLSVGLDVTNRNAFALPVTGVDYALQLAGASVGGGKAKGAMLQPGEKRRIEIPVGVNLVGASQGLLSLVAGKPADVGLKGQLGLGKVEAPLDLKKRLSLK